MLVKCGKLRIVYQSQLICDAVECVISSKGFLGVYACVIMGDFLILYMKVLLTSLDHLKGKTKTI